MCSFPTSSAQESFPGISATVTALRWRGGHSSWPTIRRGIPACPRRLRSAWLRIRSSTYPRARSRAGVSRAGRRPRQIEPRPAIFVPFADAGSTGGVFRVWLRAPGVQPASKISLLADGEESRSRRGNQNGSIIDDDPSSFVVTFNGRPAKEDWYAVTLAQPAEIKRVVFMHGQSFHDGGWFDTRGGKPRVQVQQQKGGPWETVGELGAYPATTATERGGIEFGQPFELTSRPPGGSRGRQGDRCTLLRKQSQTSVLLVRRASGVRRLTRDESW